MQAVQIDDSHIIGGDGSVWPACEEENTAGCCGMQPGQRAAAHVTTEPNNRYFLSLSAGEVCLPCGWRGETAPAGWQTAAVLGVLTQYY